MKLKKLVKQYTPSAESVSKSGLFRHISHFLLGQNIWHLNRRSISYGIFIGIFCAMLPIPGQMLVAAIMALLLRAHLPLSLAATWISNPVTYAPIYYFNYQVGAWIFGGSPEPTTPASFELIDFYEHLHALMIPLIGGSLLSGVVFGFAGLLLVRIYWRITVMMHWGERKIRHRMKYEGQVEIDKPNSDRSERP